MWRVIALMFVSAIASVAQGAASPLAASLPEFEARLREIESHGSLWPTSPAPARQPSHAWRRFAPGTSLFASSSVASIDEVVDVGRSRAYEQAAVSAGVRVPLLGSRYRSQADLASAALDTAVAALERDQRRRELLVSLRSAYVQYWFANERRRLAAEYTQFAPMLEPVLQRRTTAGLLLESDRLEFIASFGTAAADGARAEADAAAAQAALLALTETQAARRVSRPAMGSEACLLTSVEELPEIRILALRLQHLSSLRASPALRSIQSELRLGYTRSYEPRSGSPGSSAFASVTFDYAFGSAESAQHMERVRSDSVAQLLAVRRAQALSDLENLRTARTALRQSLHAAELAATAASAKLRERSLRAARLAGDVIEQLQQARYADYRARLAALAATHELLTWNVAATLYESRDCSTSPRSDAAEQTLTRQTARGLYVWSPGELLATLDEPAASPAWARLSRYDVRRVLLSFDAAELARWRDRPQELTTAVRKLQARGHQVEWLLGEPNWMLTAHRDELVAHIVALRSVPFDGLHLDLEPNQLDATSGDGREHLGDLLATLVVTKDVSPWPIGLSLHPRYMTMDVSGAPFGEQLHRLAVEPTLMVYVANHERVVATVAALRERWPDLPQRVAISLERELDDRHSIEHLPEAELHRHLGTLEAELQHSAFRGLVLQPSPDWLYAHELHETPR
jgi:hypothetical protein